MKRLGTEQWDQLQGVTMELSFWENVVDHLVTDYEVLRDQLDSSEGEEDRVFFQVQMDSVKRDLGRVQVQIGFEWVDLKTWG